jgi:hypothetical protein
MTAPQPNAASSSHPDWTGAVAPPPDAQLFLIERQLQQLAELRDLGMILARDLAAQGPEANGEAPPTARSADAFGRLTKAIRQIMALEQETVGLREKREFTVRQNWLGSKKAAVRRSVEHSLKSAKPGLPRSDRERLLRDLKDYDDYDDYERGSVRDIVEKLCKTLGVAADLSLWDQPQPADIVLPAGYKWIVPANGEKPYTVVATPGDLMVRVKFDSPHIIGRGNDPPRVN